MMATLSALVLAVSMASTGGLRDRLSGHGIFPILQDGGRILPPGPGEGWGFPNNNPDGYGWADYGYHLPLGADRTPDYFAPRYFMGPPVQCVFPQYYNPYVMRGQRYLPYVNCGGWHPAGGPAVGSAMTPVHPYNNVIGVNPVVKPPAFTGRIEASPVQSGGTGLIP